MISIEDLCEPEWAAWYRLSPQERWVTSARLWAERARECAVRRPLLAEALSGNEDGITRGLASEEAAERAADRAYWAPLRAELEALRRQARGG